MHIKITAHHKNISQQLIEQFAAYPTLSRELSDISEVDRRTVSKTRGKEFQCQKKSTYA